MSSVSVVIPSYNAARFIGAAINSILTQSHPPLEVIVVDDGSTDATPEILATLKSSRSIQVIRQQNQGPAAARNAGIAAATGELIALMDADDIALPQRLAIQSAALSSEPDLAVVSGGYEWIDEMGQPLSWPYHSWRHYPDLNDLRTWLLDCPIVPSATMLRRAAWSEVGGFNERLIGPEDWDFWMRLVLAGRRMAWQRRVVCLYRRRADSLSQDARRMSSDTTEVLRRILERPDFPSELRADGQRALALRHIDGAKRLYAAGLWDEGKTALKQAVSLDPRLVEGQPSRVEDELVAASLDPLVPDSIIFLRTALQHLPDNALPVQNRMKQLLARTCLELLVRGVSEGKYRLALKYCVPTIVRHPDWFANRYMWAILLRAFSNRRKRLKASIG